MIFFCLNAKRKIKNKKMAGYYGIYLAPAVSYSDNNSPTKLYGESSISDHIQYPQQEDEVLSVNKSKLTELSSSWFTAAGAIMGDCRDYVLIFNSTAGD